MYNLKDLKERNINYDYQHYITEKDVNIANCYLLAIEASRSSHAPKAGDILILKDGERVHIDSVENEFLKTGRITIVHNAYVPFTSLKIHDSKIIVSLNTSGGPFDSIDAENITHTGKQERKTFGFFGTCGQRANGQIKIDALVNIFKEN